VKITAEESNNVLEKVSMGYFRIFNNALKIAQAVPLTHSLYVTTSYTKQPHLTTSIVVKLANKLVFYLIIFVKFTI